jgi:hypothetical protein
MLWKRGFIAVLALASGVVGGIGAASADASMDRVFKELEPEERAHQACNLRGIDAVRKGTHLKGVDRVKTSILNPAIFKDNVVIAKGGAVRAHDHWYHLDFTCAVTSDQMKATSFDFKLGDEIPEAKWEDYGLWR